MLRNDLSLNTAPSTVMHIDLNSCFASIEQQANPKLRGCPVAVAAYPTGGGCILAASYEAKGKGVKTGMRARDGKRVCPNLVVLVPDPPKYLYVSTQFMTLFRRYSPNCVPLSVDEAVLDLAHTPSSSRPLAEIGREIKVRVQKEIGDWLKVNVGIGPNRFLAKTAASWHKPDGLDEINHDNLRLALGDFRLTDLCGINTRLQARLNAVGIFTPLEFLDASLLTLRSAFRGITAYYWFRRLRGWEIDATAFPRKSFGQSYALPHPTRDTRELSRLLCKLCEKMGRRLREGNFKALGIHVSCLYDQGEYWHQGGKERRPLYSTHQLFVAALRLLNSVPHRPVRLLAVSCFNLEKVGLEQLDLWSSVDKENQLSRALDQINDRWGEFTITPALIGGMEGTIIDRVAFGR